MTLVLSLFSGVGALDEGFRRAGFCVVSAGDVAWSSLYDVREFHPPAGAFDGVIGGDPCQSHSALANLVRAKGLEPRFSDMTGDFERIVSEARPRWFLRENVPGAPSITPAGYDVRTFLLDHSTLDSGDGVGHEQMRRRRFWFGVQGGPAPELRAHLNFAFEVLPEAPAGGGCAPRARRKTVAGDDRQTFIPGGQAEVDAIRSGEIERVHRNNGTPETTAGNSTKYSLDQMLALQGLPERLFEHSPLSLHGKRKLVGNAVPLPMAEALGRAVARAIGVQPAQAAQAASR